MVCIDGHWGTICRDSFNDGDASVVCKQWAILPMVSTIMTFKDFINI